MYGEAKTNVLNGSVANKSVNQLDDCSGGETENRNKCIIECWNWVADTKSGTICVESHRADGETAEEFIGLIA